MFLENPIGQSLWFVAMFFWIYGFLVTDDRKTIKLFIVSCVFWIIHFIFMENYGALGATVIWLIRLILSLKYKKNTSIFVGILACTLALWLYSYNGQVISMLPLFATAISSYAFFFLEKAKLRIVLAGVSLMWLTYHLETGSISWVLNEVFVQASIWFSIYKFMTGHEKKAWIYTRIKSKIQKAPIRVNYGRYMFFRDRDRFD